MGHQSKNCTSERKCGVDGCSSIQHSRFLHVERGPKQRDDNQEATPPDNETKEPSIERTHTANQADHISLMVIPAIISNGQSRLKINAMLDPCSTGTYVTESAAQQLNLQGQRQSLTISGTGGSEIKKQSARVELTVSSLDGRFSSKVQANVLDNITGDTPAIRWSELKEKWPHLKAIPFEDVSRRRQIDVLISSDHPVFHRIHREIHGSNVNDPVARLTNLGWVCFGPTSPSPSSGHSRIHSTRTYRTSTPFQEHENQTTNDLLRRFWELDALGMNDHPTCPRPTADEQAAIDQAERTLSFKNGRYEIGVPWKRNEPKFSNNYELAFPRLKNLEKSLQKKDPKIKETYKKIIEDYSIEGYVRRTTQKDENQWLLPHFPMVREDKSTTKVRVVFDAAAKYEGRCLNDAILPGPKLQLEIVDVLLRFRREPVAISADIAEMFLQVRLREEDQAFHRFLWRSRCFKRTGRVRIPPTSLWQFLLAILRSVRLAESQQIERRRISTGC